MKHTLFVAKNHFRSLDFDKAFQTVVADNYSTIEVVQVAGSEATTVERHQWTQFRRDNGYHLQNHPFGFIDFARRAECFHHLQALQCFSLALLRTFLACCVAKFVRQFVEVELAEQVLNGFGTHLGNELVGVVVVEQMVVAWQTVDDFEVFVFGEQVETLIRTTFLVVLRGSEEFRIGCGTRVEHDIAFVVDYRVELL